MSKKRLSESSGFTKKQAAKIAELQRQTKKEQTWVKTIANRNKSSKPTK
jgi:hypothetical protein